MNAETNKSLESLAQQFAIEGKVKEVKPLGDGLINDTYLVAADGGERYVLQRINRAVFPDIDALQTNLVKITSHIRKCLEDKGVENIDKKVLTPVKVSDGCLWIENDGEAWRMTRYIADSVTRTNLTDEMAEVTGYAFADFHNMMSRADAPELQETIKDFHYVSFRIKQLEDAVAADSEKRLANVQPIVDELLQRASEMTAAERLYQEGKLTKRIAHCDTKLNNILFDKSGEVLCVIDLDTTMPGFVLSDFGDFIRTAANTGAEDDPDVERVGVNMDVFKSFAKGYLKGATFLSPLERSLLPFGAQMLTYMQTVRFLTDYLNGDTYYKTAYPEHNLVRTKAQLALLHSIDAHLDEMKQYIDNYKL